MRRAQMTPGGDVRFRRRMPLLQLSRSGRFEDWKGSRGACFRRALACPGALGAGRSGRRCRGERVPGPSFYSIAIDEAGSLQVLGSTRRDARDMSGQDERVSWQLPRPVPGDSLPASARRKAAEHARLPPLPRAAAATRASAREQPQRPAPMHATCSSAAATAPRVRARSPLLASYGASRLRRRLRSRKSRRPTFGR